jgi:Zn-dependent protease with chaperone function
MAKPKNEEKITEEKSKDLPKEMQQNINNPQNIGSIDININENNNISPVYRKRIFPGIAIKAIQHPFDAKATELLSKVPLLPQLLKFLNKVFQEESLYVLYHGSYLKVSPIQYPRLYKVFEEAVNILDLKVMPTLFLANMGSPIVFSAGVEQPFIIVSSEMTEILSEEELLFMIGREIGLIKFGQNIYKTLAALLGIAGAGGISILSNFINIGGFNLGGIGSVAAGGGLFILGATLIYWERMTHFSGDRAGFLVVQDKEVALKALSKLAGFSHKYYDNEINIEAVLEQAKLLDNTNFIQTIHKFLAMIQLPHPFIAYRIKELNFWADSQEAQSILNGYYPLEINYYQQQKAPYAPYPPYGTYPTYSPYQGYPQQNIPYPQQIYTLSSTQINKPYLILNKIYLILNKIYLILNKIYLILNKIYLTLNKIYLILNKIYLILNKIYLILNNPPNPKVLHKES